MNGERVGKHEGVRNKSDTERKGIREGYGLSVRGARVIGFGC